MGISEKEREALEVVGVVVEEVALSGVASGLVKGKC